MRKYFSYLFLGLALWACTPAAQPDPTPDPDPGPEPVPVDPVIPEAVPRYVWIDAAANFPYFANDKAYIAKEVKQLAEIGFTDLVVDVRPTEATVLWNSAVAPSATRLATWQGSHYGFVYREATWDYLQAFIDIGHAEGLKVHASLNTFVGGYGGYYGLESEGPIFSGKIPASWATVQNTADGLRSSFYEGVQGTVFLNPANDDVQAYILSLLKEVAAYDVDGIILDRCRYDDSGLQSDFSDISKTKFTEYIGGEPIGWPIFPAGSTTLPVGMGDQQKDWLAFRCKIIHDFIVKAADAVHGVNPKVKFGAYVGAWYSDYYTSGVNWASPRYLTHKLYSKWANSDYHNYGYADHCDYMFLGCYASTQSIYGTTEWTMEGFAARGRSLLMGDTVFAGGPDIGNPEGWQNGLKSAYIPKTFDAIVTKGCADGYFVFDLCHIRMFEYWNAFKKTFQDYTDTLTN